MLMVLVTVGVVIVVSGGGFGVGAGSIGSGFVAGGDCDIHGGRDNGSDDGGAEVLLIVV